MFAQTAIAAVSFGNMIVSRRIMKMTKVNSIELRTANFLSASYSTVNTFATIKLYACAIEKNETGFVLSSVCEQRKKFSDTINLQQSELRV